MREDYPPLQLPQPQIEARRPEKPRSVPLSVEMLAKRDEIIRRLGLQITPLSNSLKSMTNEERRAVFYKLEHTHAISLTGTGLKAVSEPSERFTLAVPTGDDLSAFTKKLDKFGKAIPKRGVVPDSQLLTAIESIQVGEPKDRLSEELLEHYESLIKREYLICEVELLSLQKGAIQQRNELRQFRHLLKAELDQDKGFGALFEHEEIKGTCRIVIRCTGQLFKKLVEDVEWQRRIYWFEARPEFQTFHRIVEDFDVSNLGPITGPPPGAPIVCVIDSGVTAGNPFLRPVVREDFLRSFLKTAPDDPSDQFGHGTGVASLVSYYALNPSVGAENSGKIWIASARILTAENNLEDERLYSSLLREVVEYFAPRGIKIFNLSVNSRTLSWHKNAKRTHPRRSWTARTIDQLSAKHGIIFVVSTGNIIPTDVRDFYDRGEPYPIYFAEEEACILDPGQAALALSVGSIAPTTLAEGQVGRAEAIALQDHASPFTRCGPGIRQEIKPELVDRGGNYLRDEEGGQIRLNRGLGMAVATNQLTPALTYDSGTSFAAPRTTHKLGLVLGDLNALGVGPSADLVKAFLVNSAQYPITSGEFDDFKTRVGEDHWQNVLGYGVPDEVRATYCDPYSVILFYQGTIKPNNIAFFDIPIPENLMEAGREIKRLTVTVVHSPEVQRWGLERYLGTSIKWRVFRGDVSRDSVITAMSISEEDETGGASRSAEQGAGPDELNFDLGISKRSRGTIQHDVCEWKIHKPEFSAHNYTLAVAAYERWGRPHPPVVPFAVVVRIEESSQKTEIYNEIKNALVSLEVQTRT